MHLTFETWLGELQTESEYEEWCISDPEAVSNSPQDWCVFLTTAFEIRSARWGTDLTSYAWHDEMASQLRFNTGPYSPETLPFGRSVRLVDSPLEIIQSWMGTSSHIPWEDLEIEEEELSSSEVLTRDQLTVWAVEHSRIEGT